MCTAQLKAVPVTWYTALFGALGLSMMLPCLFSTALYCLLYFMSVGCLSQKVISTFILNKIITEVFPAECGIQVKPKKHKTCFFCLLVPNTLSVYIQNQMIPQPHAASCTDAAFVGSGSGSRSAHPHSPEMSHASALSLWDYPLRKPTIYQEHADPAWAQCLSSSMPRHHQD